MESKLLLEKPDLDLQASLSIKRWAGQRVLNWAETQQQQQLVPADNRPLNRMSLPPTCWWCSGRFSDSSTWAIDLCSSSRVAATKQENPEIYIHNLWNRLWPSLRLSPPGHTETWLWLLHWWAETRQRICSAFLPHRPDSFIHGSDSGEASLVLSTHLQQGSFYPLTHNTLLKIRAGQYGLKFILQYDLKHVWKQCVL